MVQDRDYGNTRFIGGHIPIELFQAMEAARGDHGIGNRSEVIRDAVALWVQDNPPDSGISKAMAELIQVTSVTKATREAMDQAIREWRASHSPLLLEKIKKLDKESGALNLPGDIREAINKS